MLRIYTVSQENDYYTIYRTYLCVQRFNQYGDDRCVQILGNVIPRTSPMIRPDIVHCLQLLEDGRLVSVTILISK